MAHGVQEINRPTIVNLTISKGGSTYCDLCHRVVNIYRMIIGNTVWNITSFITIYKLVIFILDSIGQQSKNLLFYVPALCAHTINITVNNSIFHPKLMIREFKTHIILTLYKGTVYVTFDLIVYLPQYIWAVV